MPDHDSFLVLGLDLSLGFTFDPQIKVQRFSRLPIVKMFFACQRQFIAMETMPGTKKVLVI